MWRPARAGLFEFWDVDGPLLYPAVEPVGITRVNDAVRRAQSKQFAVPNAIPGSVFTPDSQHHETPSSPEPTRHHSHAVAAATGHASLYWYQVVPAFVISPTGQWSGITAPDDHGERLCFGSTIALRGLALNLSAMRGDEVQKKPFVVVGTDVRVSVPSLCHGSRERWAASTCIPREWADV